jgi:uncharacterized protein YjiS (DUF1127 family)
MAMHFTTHSPRQDAWVPRSDALAALRRAAAAPGRALGWLVACNRRAAERAELRSLDSRDLRDVGLNRAREEMHKPSWVE